MILAGDQFVVKEVPQGLKPIAFLAALSARLKSRYFRAVISRVG